MSAREPREHTRESALNWLDVFGPRGWFGSVGLLLTLVTPAVLWWIAIRVTKRINDENRERDDRLKREERDRDSRLKREETERDNRLKRIESTLEFSKRFQSLIRDRRELNRKFSDAHGGKDDAQPTQAEIEEGRDWWWAFFDLLLFEFDFFQSGLVREERFIEWMKWRWYDYHPEIEEEVWKTSGMTYQKGWDWWRSRRAHKDNRLIRFLEEVHNAAKPEDVPAIVRKHARQSGEQTALEVDTR